MNGMVKVGIGLVVLVVGGVGLFAVLGGRSFEYEQEVVLAAPARDVYVCLSHSEVQRAWSPNITRVEADAVGAARVGERRVLEMQRDGEPMRIEQEILECEPNRLIAFRLTASQWAAEYRYELQPDGKRTTLRLRMTGQAKGLARFASGYVRGELENQVDQDLSRLRAYAENTPQLRRLLRELQVGG